MNRDHYRAKTRELYSSPEGKLKHYNRVSKSYRTWLSHCLSALKSGAKKPGVHSPKDDLRRQFDIDLNYVIEILEKQEYKCAITRRSLTHRMNDLHAASIDRIDGKLGHVRGNIQIVEQAINYAKRHYPDRLAREYFAELMSGRRESTDFELGQLEIRRVTFDEYNDFYACYHYMGRTSRTGTTLGVYLNGILIAAATISVLTRTETAIKQGYRADQVRELARFCIHPDYHKKNLGSWFLSRVIQMVKQEMPEIYLLVSFADTTVGHEGTLYAAGNWKYDGDTTPSYHYVGPDGRMIHKKTIFDQAKKVGQTENQYVESHGLRKIRHLPKKRFTYLLRT